MLYAAAREINPHFGEWHKDKIGFAGFYSRILDVHHVFRHAAALTSTSIQSGNQERQIMQTETLKLDGMPSEAAVAAVIHALTQVNGVQTVKVSYADQSAVVEFDEQRTAKQELMAALAKAGFGRSALKQAELAQGSCCGGCCS